MPDIDKDKIKDMTYDPSRGRYIGKDGSELKVIPYSDGSGYKYDYYPSSTYVNAPHDSTHIKSDISGSWSRTDNDRSQGSQTQSSGNCYLTTACMKHFQGQFDDNCYELNVLRWFRDTFVTKEDIEYYYEVAPTIIKSINELEDNEKVYDYIYDIIIEPCVEAIEKGDYEFAYSRYKSSVLALNQNFGAKEKGLVKKLGTYPNGMAFV